MPVNFILDEGDHVALLFLYFCNRTSTACSVQFWVLLIYIVILY